VVGITFVLGAYRYAADKVWALLQKDEIAECFDTTTENYTETWRRLFRLAGSNKGSFLGASVWVAFIVWRATVHYPEPIHGFSVYPYYYHTYNPLEWYVLGVFLLAMTILGTGSWNILAGAIGLTKIRFRVFPEAVAQLREFNSFLLAAVGAWYFCVAVSAPVLILFSSDTNVFVGGPLQIMNPITVTQSAIGIVLFVAPQFLLHNSVVVVKHERLLQIRHFYRMQFDRLLQSIKDPEDAESLFRLFVVTSSAGSIVEQTEKLPTWLVDYSVIGHLALETIVSVLATSAFPRLLGIS
jgi:hypothetical protein